MLICHAIHKYAKANNKYMKNIFNMFNIYTIFSSYIQYLLANNLYGWATSQKLPVNGFERVKNASKANEEFIKKFVKTFMKKYDENTDKGYIFEVDIEYPKDLHDLHKIYHFYHVIHMRNLKGLNHRLILTKIIKLVKLKKINWEKKQKNDFENNWFFKLMNKGVFGKTMVNVRKHKDIKLVTTNRGRNCLVSEPNYHTTK